MGGGESCWWAPGRTDAGHMRWGTSFGAMQTGLGGRDGEGPVPMAPRKPSHPARISGPSWWWKKGPKERRGPASPVVLCFQSRFPAFATWRRTRWPTYDAWRVGEMGRPHGTPKVAEVFEAWALWCGDDQWQGAVYCQARRGRAIVGGCMVRAHHSRMCWTVALGAAERGPGDIGPRHVSPIGA